MANKLINRIKTCKNDIRKRTNAVDNFSSQLRIIVHFINYIFFVIFFRLRNKNYSDNDKATHQREFITL